MTRLRALLAALALTLALGATACSGSGDPSYPPCPDTALTCPQGGGQSSWASPVPLASPTSRGPGSPAAQGMGGSAGPGTSASASRSASATTAVQAAGFPDARTTGPRIPLTPHNTGAMSVKTSGTVIRGWDITGSLDIYANNVTIVDTKITSTNWWGVNLRPGYSGLRVIHSTITAIPGKGPDNGGEDYAVSNSGDSSIEVGWSDISVFGNALSMGQGNIHDNYVHDLVAFRNAGGEWQHVDAVISGGGSTGKLTIRHNTLLNPVAVDRGASASIGLFSDTGTVTNTVIDGNLLAGGAYALYGGGDGATGIKVTNNVFSTQFHSKSGVYGAVTAWNEGGAGNVWTNNRMADGTAITPKPAG